MILLTAFSSFGVDDCCSSSEVGLIEVPSSEYVKALTALGDAWRFADCGTGIDRSDEVVLRTPFFWIVEIRNDTLIARERLWILDSNSFPVFRFFLHSAATVKGSLSRYTIFPDWHFGKFVLCLPNVACILVAVLIACLRLRSTLSLAFQWALC